MASFLKATENQNVPIERTVPTIRDWDGLHEHLASYLRRGDRLALMLDFDGTLAPITRNPINTVIAPESLSILRRLSLHPNVFVAIISGRGPADVQQRVALPNITYSGNHGLEIYQPDGSRWALDLSGGLRANFERMVQLLEHKVARSGAWVENKNVSLTFHYREAPVAIHTSLHLEATGIIEALGYHACPAHYAIEAKPPVHWNKGEAALKILRDRFGSDWPIHTRAIFAGDDTSDEDAMRALQGRGRTFRVSASPSVRTFADYRLASTDGVTMLLDWIEQTL